MIDEIDLSGMYDLHIHTAPDVSDRCLDDLEAAEQAEDAGMAGILLKSHHTLTADRAVIAAKGVSKLKVYGSLTLNDAVGGLNIAAVETALKMGAREIFMPTISAANHRGRRGRKTGIDLLDCAFVDPLREILSLVKDYNAILGTGHISKEETRFLVQMALGQGLKKIVVTHPELPLVAPPQPAHRLHAERAQPRRDVAAAPRGQAQRRPVDLLRAPQAEGGALRRRQGPGPGA